MLAFLVPIPMWLFVKPELTNNLCGRLVPSAQLNRKWNIFLDLGSRLSPMAAASICLAFLSELQAAKAMHSVLVVSSDLFRCRFCPQSDVAPVNKPLDSVNHNTVNRGVWLSPDFGCFSFKAGGW